MKAVLRDPSRRYDLLLPAGLLTAVLVVVLLIMPMRAAASTLVQDTFTRPNQSGWGTASDGNPWSTGAGLSVVSNQGAITYSGTSQFVTLGNATAADADGLVRFSIKATNETAGIILREQSNGDMYLARYNGAGGVEVRVFSSGKWTVLASAGVTVTAGAAYWLRFSALGSSLRLNIWRDGTSEPTGWTVSTTNSILGAAGMMGLYGWAGGSASVRFDSFSVSSAAAAGPTPTPSPTPSATPTPTPTALPTPTPNGDGGLFLTTQTRGGVVNGPPNNQTETDVNWQDTATGNGWQVGVVPAYGGANTSFWSEIDAGVVGRTQTALNTTTPCGMVHDFSNINSDYTGSEDYKFSTVEARSPGAGVWVSFTSTAPATGTDRHGFVHHLTTYVYPGDPGLIFQRLDLTNPSSSAIKLSASDSLELAMIGCLQQADSTWQAGNGHYGSLSGTVGKWPVSLSNGDPDYYYITPAPGSTVKDGVAAVRKSGLSAAGATNLKFQYQQNSHRIKLNTSGNLPTFPAHTTASFYILQTLSRTMSAGEAAGIAADYLNPDTPAAANGSFTGFSYDDGAYHFTSATGSSLGVSMNLTSTVPERWLPAFDISAWTSPTAPTLKVSGVPLVQGLDYVSTFDDATHTAYVKLLKPLAGAGTAGALTNGTITIS